MISLPNLGIQRTRCARPPAVAVLVFPRRLRCLGAADAQRWVVKHERQTGMEV